MIFKDTKLQDLRLIELQARADDRGFFARVWCEREFQAAGLPTDICQSNISFNKCRGTLRGMHYQRDPFGEDKLVTCLQGTVYDVVVDLRPGSKTYLKWAGFELSAENRLMLFVPKGFAHGYQTLGNDSLVLYFTTQFYTPESEAGIRFNDPAFGIRWPEEVTSISDKDRNWPDFVPSAGTP